MTVILNFTHPITPDQHEQLSSMLGGDVEVRNITVQIDHTQPIQAQASAIADAANLTPTEWQGLPLLINLPGYAPADAANLTPTEWQGLPLLINLPGYAPAAVALIAELHGRMGYIPAFIRTRPVPNTTPTRYEVAEIVRFL